MRPIKIEDCRAVLIDGRLATTATDAILSIRLNVSRDEHHAEIEELCPGFLATVAAMAVADAPRRETKLPVRRMLISVLLHAGDKEKTQILKCDLASIKAIKIVVQTSAASVDVDIKFLGTLKAAEWAALRENRNADLFASLTMTADGIEKKRGRPKKTVAAPGVDERQMDLMNASGVTDAEHDDEVDEDDDEGLGEKIDGLDEVAH